MAKLLVTCQHCGRQNHYNVSPAQLAASPRKLAQLNSDTRHIFDQVADAPPLAQPAALGEWRKSTPVAKLQSGDITAVLYDSGVVLIIVAIAGSFFTWLIWGGPWYIVGPAFGFLAGSIRYLGGVNFARGLTRVVETAINRDIDGDGHVGRPQPESRTIEIVHKNERGGVKSMHRFDHLSANTVEHLDQFAKAVLAGRGLAEANWTGRSGLFSKSEYGALMDALSEAGIVQWVNPKAKAQGREVTRGGRRALSELAKG